MFNNRSFDQCFFAFHEAFRFNMHSLSPWAQSRALTLCPDVLICLPRKYRTTPSPTCFPMTPWYSRNGSSSRDQSSEISWKYSSGGNSAEIFTEFCKSATSTAMEYRAGNLCRSKSEITCWRPVRKSRIGERFTLLGIQTMNVPSRNKAATR